MTANATLTLTPPQVEFFQQERYLSLPAITTPEEVAGLRDIYDRLFATQASRAQGDHLDLSGTDEDGAKAVLPQILNPSKYAPELAHTIFRANATAIARQLLDHEAEYRGDHGIRKAPHTEAPTPWHQDEAYWDPNLDYSELSIWIPLQEATLENGCLQFVPGTHRQEVLPHHPIGNDTRVIGFEVDELEARAAAGVVCPIPAGSATVHHSAPTLHRSQPRQWPTAGLHSYLWHTATSAGDDAPLLLAGTAKDQVAGTPRGREGLGARFEHRLSAGRVTQRPRSKLNPTNCLSRRRS